LTISTVAVTARLVISAIVRTNVELGDGLDLVDNARNYRPKRLRAFSGNRAVGVGAKSAATTGTERRRLNDICCNGHFAAPTWNRR
jgi:hypothetical protein